MGAAWKHWLRTVAQAVLRTPPNTGAWGEHQAAQHLRAKGYRIVGRRVRVGRRDEFDVVAREGETLVFVEVKTRRHEAYGRPLAAVDRAKRHYLSRAAVRYLKALNTTPPSFRFDVVEVIGAPQDPAPPLIRHVTNAFPLDSRYRVP